MSPMMLRSQATAAGPRCQQLHGQPAPVPSVIRPMYAPGRTRDAIRTHPRPRRGTLQHPPPVAAAAAAGRAAAASGSASAAEASTQQQQRSGDEFFASDRRPIILFDGVCNLCNGGVNFMLAWDREGRFRFAALQSEAGRALLRRAGRSPDDISSIVLVEQDAAHIKSAAILRIAAGLQAPLPVVAAALDVFPRPFKDWFYDQVADNRYSFFGRTSACRLSDPRFDERFVS
ncbi:hypothetical protein ABPG75_009556 [Micractinium tetrahymenae]